MFRKTVLHWILLIGMICAGLPFVWMFFTSFKSFREVVTSSALLPITWTLESYIEIIDRVGFLTGFKNSITVAVPAVAQVLVTSVAAGYVFAKYEFPLKEAIFKAILATMMVPFTVAIIPLFLTMNSLGLLDKLWGIIVTSACSTFGIFMMRQSIETIPNDYLDAARIDGASEWWIVWQVICPLSMASITTLAVFTFLGSWDSYIWPSVVLKSSRNHTLPLIIAGMRNLFHDRYQLWAAGSMLTVVPVMLLFTFAQKHFIGGLSMTGLKG